MKKIFTTILMAGLMASAATAADYITTPMTVSPADGTTMGAIGLIDIQWKGVDLVVEDTDTSVKNKVDLSYITVYLNGEENTAWQNYMGAEAYVHHVETTNEQYGSSEGGEVQDLGYMFTMYFGTMSFLWTGELNVTIAEGAVQATTGEINPEINLTYYLKSVTDWTDINYEPASGSTFEPGEGIVYVSWNVEGDLSFNPETRYNVYAVKYDLEGGPENTINLTGATTIEDNTLVISLASLAPGRYSLIIPEGAIFIGTDKINLDAIDYDFTIAGEETGISSLTTGETGINAVYNLNGVKVNPSSLGKGLYIINGKKVLVK